MASDGGNGSGKGESVRVTTVFGDDGTPVTVTVLGEAHAQTARSAEDRKFAARYLHHSGEMRESLTDDEAWDLYCLADGFGSRTPGELREINDGWDWSHIRDSSPEALATIRSRLEAITTGKRRA